MSKAKTTEQHCIQYAAVKGLFVYDTDQMTDDEVWEAVSHLRSNNSFDPLGVGVERYNRCPVCEAWTKNGDDIRDDIDCTAIQTRKKETTTGS